MKNLLAVITIVAVSFVACPKADAQQRHNYGYGPTPYQQYYQHYNPYQYNYYSYQPYGYYNYGSGIRIQFPNWGITFQQPYRGYPNYRRCR